MAVAAVAADAFKNVRREVGSVIKFGLEPKCSNLVGIQHVYCAVVNRHLSLENLFGKEKKPKCVFRQLEGFG